MNRVRSAVAVVAAVILSVGCVSVLGAETPEQQFYAAQGLYVIAGQEAIDYMSRPDADPRVVSLLKTADNEAYQALRLGRALLAQPASADRDQRLVLYATVAQAAIAKLSEVLTEEANR